LIAVRLADLRQTAKIPERGQVRGVWRKAAGAVLGLQRLQVKPHLDIQLAIEPAAAEQV
jgi:hypothetical protein